MSLAVISLSIQLFSLGVLNILSTVYVVIIGSVEQFRTSVNIIIGNFAIACAVAAICRAWLDIYYTYYPSLFEEFVSFCIVKEHIPFLNNCFPIYTLVMITVNRYLIIQYSNKAIFKRKKWALLSSLIPWGVSFLLCIPQLAVGVQRCIYKYPANIPIRYYNLFIIVILPSTINTALNFRIFLNARSSSQRIHDRVTVTQTSTTMSNSTTKENRLRPRDLSLLKHMFFIFSVFFFTWTPVFVCAILTAYIKINTSILILIRIPVSLNGCILITDLFLYNHEVRRALRNKILSILRPRQN